MTNPDQKTIGEVLDFPLDPASRALFSQAFNALPGVAYQGVRVDLSDDKLARLYLDEVLPHHLGGMGTDAVNGACLSGAMDAVLGVAGVLHLGAWANGRKSGTIELSIQIIRSVVGRKFMAQAGVIKRTNELAFCRGEIIDEQGRVCVTATGLVAAASSQTS